MLENKIDAMGMQETNIYWHKMRNKHKIQDRFIGCREEGGCHLLTAYKSSDKISERSQYVGAFLITLNILATRTLENGVDETKLGKWTQTRYIGSKGKIFHVVSVYRPNHSDKYNSAYL